VAGKELTMFNPWPPAPPQSPLHGWRDASGRLHWFSIYPLGNTPSWIGQCVYFFARPRHDPAQFRDPLYIGEKGDTDRFENHEKLRPALALGGTELHVHFTSGSRWERLDIETDLRNTHWTPLNDQPTRAEPVNGLAALAGFGMPSSGGILGALGYQPPSPARTAGIGALAAIDALQPPNPLAALASDDGLNALLRALGTPR
jgi:hypothetical protein